MKFVPPHCGVYHLSKPMRPSTLSPILLTQLGSRSSEIFFFSQSSATRSPWFVIGAVEETSSPWRLRRLVPFWCPFGTAQEGVHFPPRGGAGGGGGVPSGVGRGGGGVTGLAHIVLITSFWFPVLSISKHLPPVGSALFEFLLFKLKVRLIQHVFPPLCSHGS